MMSHDNAARTLQLLRDQQLREKHELMRITVTPFHTLLVTLINEVVSVNDTTRLYFRGKPKSWLLNVARLHNWPVTIEPHIWI
jgi:hypothetical protein